MALWIFIGQVFAKLSPRPVARDVATTTTTSAAAQSTICGDIIDEVNQGNEENPMDVPYRIKKISTGRR